MTICRLQPSVIITPYHKAGLCGICDMCYAIASSTPKSRNIFLARVRNIYGHFVYHAISCTRTFAYIHYIIIQGAANLAAAAKEVGLRRIVLISSIMVTPKHRW